MNFGRKLVIGSALAIAGLVVLLVNQGSRGLGGSAREGRPSTSMEEITLYCAASMKLPVERAARAFSKKYSVQVNLEYGGSGTLLSKLAIAKTGDLYLAADQSYIEKAHAMGLVAEQIPLAVMRPVIAVAKGNPKNITAINDLFRPDLRISLGNPGAASIGKQTRNVLEEAGIWEDVKAQVVAKGVFKPAVPEVATDVQLGAVDAAVIWDAMVNQYPELEAVRTPEFEAVESEVTIGVLTCSKHPTRALRFARFLNSKLGKSIFNETGFIAIAEGDWVWTPEIDSTERGFNFRAREKEVE